MTTTEGTTQRPGLRDVMSGSGPSGGPPRLLRRRSEDQRDAHEFRVGGFRKRMVFVLVAIALCFAGILVRVGMLQTTQAKAYQAYTVRQRAKNETLPAPRGQILDRSGRPLAMSVASKSIYADPRAIVDSGRTVVALARVLGFSAKRQKALLAQLSVPSTSFVYVAREVEAETALDFPGEARGILRPNAKWRGTENVTVAYGQGVAATAIQLVSAVNVIANGGVYVAPKLVASIVSPLGKQGDTMPSASRRVVSASVASQMNFLMRDVVCTGTAKGWAGIKGYTIAGKTGTGYKAQRNGTYFDEQGRRAYYASFVGFLPAEDPKPISVRTPPLRSSTGSLGPQSSTSGSRRPRMPRGARRGRRAKNDGHDPSSGVHSRVGARSLPVCSQMAPARQRWCSGVGDHARLATRGGAFDFLLSPGRACGRPRSRAVGD